MDFWVSPAAPQKQEAKTTKLPASSWLPLLWAHCWSIAHRALCQNQFWCLSGPPTAELSPPAHFNQTELLQWVAWLERGWSHVLMHTHAWPVKPVQLLKAEEDNETEARWSVHLRVFIVCPWNLRWETGFCAVKVTIYSPPATCDYAFHIINLSVHLTFKWETCSRLELLLKGRLTGADICSVAIRSGMGKCFWKLLYIKMKIFPF